MGIQTKKAVLFLQQLRLAFKLLQKNDPLRLAGATAFFANFALPPILLIFIRLFGFFVDRKNFSNQLFERLANVLDESSTIQIRQVLRNIRGIDNQLWVTLLSFAFFIFVATTLFSVIKNSLDQIWRIGLNEKTGFIFRLKIRGRAMIIILLAGMLFFIGLMADGMQAIIGTFLSQTAPAFSKIMLGIINEFIFILIVSTWFSVLFRFLTNGRPTWIVAWKGGLLTAILFNLGKYILRIMLPLSNIGNVYGASGSIVLIMLFVFYSSLIFYFGACFVKILSDQGKKQIKPVKGAFLYELKEVEGAN